MQAVTRRSATVGYVSLIDHGFITDLEILSSLFPIWERISAVPDAVARAAHFLNVSPDEILNRGTVAGEVQISRLPGAVQLSLQVPREILEENGLWNIVSSQYDIP